MFPVRFLCASQHWAITTTSLAQCATSSGGWDQAGRTFTQQWYASLLFTTVSQRNSLIDTSLFLFPWLKLILLGNWLLQVIALRLPRLWKIHNVPSSPPTLPSNVFAQNSLIKKGILYCNPEDLQMLKSAIAPFLSHHRWFCLLFRHV